MLNGISTPLIATTQKHQLEFTDDYYTYLYPESPSKTKQFVNIVFRMIHGARIPDPAKGQRLVDLNLLGI